jgi:hypothetical protein
MSDIFELLNVNKRLLEMNSRYDCFCTCSVFCSFLLLCFYYFHSLLMYYAEKRLQGEFFR